MQFLRPTLPRQVLPTAEVETAHDDASVQVAGWPVTRQHPRIGFRRRPCDPLTPPSCPQAPPLATLPPWETTSPTTTSPDTPPRRPYAVRRPTPRICFPRHSDANFDLYLQCVTTATKRMKRQSLLRYAGGEKTKSPQIRRWSAKQIARAAAGSAVNTRIREKSQMKRRGLLLEEVALAGGDVGAWRVGGPSGARTLDTRIKSPVLCRLS